VTKLRLDAFPNVLERIAPAILHARRRHVLRVPVREQDPPCAGEQRFARSFLGKQRFCFRLVSSFPLPSEAGKLEVVLP
jgi:hypothetical protein